VADRESTTDDWKWWSARNTKRSLQILTLPALRRVSQHQPAAGFQGLLSVHYAACGFHFQRRVNEKKKKGTARLPREFPFLSLLLAARNVA